jgi:hypothetical protein
MLRTPGGRADRRLPRPGSRLVPRLALGLVLGLTLIGAPTPAAADGPPIGPLPNNLWPDAAACATGAFTGHIVRPTSGEPLLTLSGWAQRCLDEKGEPPTDAERFGFAYFRPGLQGQDPSPVGTMREWRLRPYEPGVAATAWDGTFDTSGTGTHRDAAPICLMRDSLTRVACLYVELVTEREGPTYVVTPLPINDLRVAGHRIEWAARPTGPIPTPECAGCV